MSAAAILYTVRLTLFNLLQTLKGEDSAEFWKIIDDINSVRLLYDAQAKAVQFADAGIAAVVAETAITSVCLPPPRLGYDYEDS